MRLSYQTVAEIMQTEVTTIEAGASVRSLVRLLTEKAISGVPVVDREGRVIGVVSASDVLREAAGEPDRGLAGTAEPGDAGSAAGPIEGYYEDAGGPHLRCEPLVLSLVPPDWLDSRRVSDIMTRAVHAVRPKTTLDNLARLFLKTGIHRALVMEEGDLVGLVTTFDVLHCLVGRAEVFQRSF
jgi:CBS domain-containing protein